MRLTRTELIAELPLLEGPLLQSAQAWMRDHPHPLWLRATTGEVHQSVAAALVKPLAELGAGDPAQAALDPLLGHDDARVRLAAVRAFATRGEGAAAAALIGALRREQDADVLRALAGAVVAVGGAKGIAGLSTLLGHADARVRAATVDALGCVRDEAVLGRLLVALVDADPRVALVVARVMSTYRSAALLAAIDGALEGGDARAATGALHALRFFPPAEAVERLITGLRRRGSRERRTAALSLAALAAAPAPPAAPGGGGGHAGLKGLSAGTSGSANPKASRALRPPGPPPSPADFAATTRARELVQGMGWTWAVRPRLPPWAGAQDPVHGRPVEPSLAAGPTRAWLTAADPEAEPPAWPSSEAAGEVARLVELLRGPDASHRATAALLGAIGPRDAWATRLAELTREGAGGDADLVALALGRAGRGEIATPALLAQLSAGQDAAAGALLELLAGDAAPGSPLFALDARLTEAQGDGPEARLGRMVRAIEGAAAAATASAADADDSEPAPDARHLATLIQAGQVTLARVRRWLPVQRVPAAVIALLELSIELGMPDRADVAGPFVQSPELTVRQAVLKLLLSTTGKAADESLFLLVQDRDDDLARAAFDSLRKRSIGVARDALTPLLASGGKTPLVRRGLMGLEALGEPSSWPALLEVCRHPLGDGVADEVARLLATWLPGTALDELQKAHAAAHGVHRRGIKSVADVLGRRLGHSPAEIAERFPEPVKGSAPVRLPADLRERTGARRAGAAVATTVAVLALVMWWGSESKPGKLIDLSNLDHSTVHQPKSAPVQTATRARRSPPEEVLRVNTSGSASDIINQVLETQRTRTLATVEKEVAAEMAAAGLHSAKMARIVALDRAEQRYTNALTEARNAFYTGNADRAIEVLEAALNEMEPDHLFARAEILKTLVIAARRKSDYKRARGYQDQLLAVKADWLKIFTEAAGQAGASSAEIKAFEQAYNQRESNRDQALRVADLFRPTTEEDKQPAN